MTVGYWYQYVTAKCSGERESLIPSLASGYCRVTQRGPGLWDVVCSPKMQWWSLLALADLYVINSPYTQESRSGEVGERKRDFWTL